MNVTVGTVVVRKSYSGDIYFIVVDIWGETAILKGLFHRLMADAPLDDLIRVPERKKRQLFQKLAYPTKDL